MLVLKTMHKKLFYKYTFKSVIHIILDKDYEDICGLKSVSIRPVAIICPIS